MFCTVLQAGSVMEAVGDCVDWDDVPSLLQSCTLVNWTVAQTRIINHFSNTLSVVQGKLLGYTPESSP